MAKKKRKIDWKGILLAHGEKVVAALIGIAALAIIWIGVGRERLPPSRGPDDMVQVSKVAQSNITVTPWEQFSQRPEEKDYSSRSIMDEIDLAPYKLKNSYDPGVFQSKPRRVDPVLLPVTDLEAKAGFDPLVLVDEETAAKRAENPEDEKYLQPNIDVSEGRGAQERRVRAGVRPAEGDVVRGQRWIVVTGLVPVAEQQDKYDAAFQVAEGYDPRNDVPMYRAYFVERREVAADGSSLEWKSLGIMMRAVVLRQTTYWAGTSKETVAEKFLHRQLTYPLPPIALRNWGSEVSHSRLPKGGDEPVEPARPRPKQVSGALDDLIGGN
jgi:hypothetical protein